MAHNTINSDSALRDYLLAMYVDLRAMFSRTLPDDTDRGWAFGVGDLDADR
jgi:hypothetical protein